jgi:hypothetical protein
MDDNGSVFVTDSENERRAEHTHKFLPRNTPPACLRGAALGDVAAGSEFVCAALVPVLCDPFRFLIGGAQSDDAPV